MAMLSNKANVALSAMGSASGPGRPGLLFYCCNLADSPCQEMTDVRAPWGRRRGGGL